MPWWPLVLGAGLVLALVMLRLSQRGRRFALELSANWRRLVDAASGVSKEQRLVLYVLRYATKGNPQSVLDTIDRYCREQTWHMNVGDDKGKILDEEVKKKKPAVAIEMGAYCGYSAVRVGRLLPPGGRLYSFEIDSKFAANARLVVEHAGLSGKVVVIDKSVADGLKTLPTLYGVRCVDLVFIDHSKTRYLPDLQLLEASGLLVPGSVLVADNVIYPGAPDYLAYVRSSPHYVSTCHRAHLEYRPEIEDAVEVSVFRS